MPLPEKPFFTLWELANEWEKTFEKPNLTEQDVLNYGAGGLLVIHVKFEPYWKVEELTFSDQDDSKKELLSSKNYSGNGLEPLNKEALRKILMNNFVELQEITSPLYPNRVLELARDRDKFIVSSRKSFPSIRMTDLYVLKVEKQKFENHYLNQKQEKDDVTDSPEATKANHINDIGRSCFNNKDHPDFAPELAIACEIWNHLYIGEKYKRGTKIETQVKKYIYDNKERIEEMLRFGNDKKDKITKELIKRIKIIITPIGRKGGGVESID